MRFFKQRDKKDLYEQEDEAKGTEISSDNIKSILGKSKDIVFTDINIGEKNSITLTVVYVDGLIDKKLLNDDILKPLIQEPDIRTANSENKVMKHIENGQVYCSYPKTRTKAKDCINDIINGSAALIFDKEKAAITFDVKGFDKRAITEPTGENVVKGSKDAFVETLRVNTAIIRRKIKTPDLVVEETTVGKQTLTSIGIVYIDGIANRHIVDEVKKRLDSIQVDGVLSAGFIEEYIIDNTLSPFPQVVVTERTDKLCSHILSGKVGIIIDGLPVTYALPGVLNMFLHAPEDYAQNFWISSFLRFLRYILMVVTLFTPAFYIAVTSFHQEMLPTELAVSIESSKEGVPFPTFIEVIFMLIAFEVLLEAGLRLPKSIGQAVSIVGALVVGEAAVNAKLISPAVVIIIAATAISSFAMPNQDFSNALRLWRFIIVIFSSIIGLFGLSIGTLLLLFHFAKMETFGVPYLAPYVAQEGKQMEDSLIRLPLRFFKKRPFYLKTTNERRQK